MFASLPPEVNSGRMYTGPGAESMLVAASAWDTVAGELYATAVSVDSMIRGLISGPWLGATATAMAAAAASYVAWLKTTAAQAEQAAAQARAAAAAYLTAHAMTVPPALVAANRAQLESLIATDALGQNAPAIAATEAQYGEMWAQDAAAMYCYAAASTAATTPTPFTPPAEITDPSGQVANLAALVQATGDSVATEITNAAAQLTSAVPAALAGIGGLAAPSALPSWVSDLQTVMSIFGTPFFASTSLAGLGMSMLSNLKGLFPAAAAVGAQVATSVAPTATGALTSSTLSAAVSAGLGKATTVGALSVPQAWAATAPVAPAATAAAAAPLPRSALSAAVDTLDTASPGGLLGGMPLAQLGSRAVTGGLSRLEFRSLRVLPEVVG
ncbi:PPE family protein [Mycobacterium pseudokansasii]|uniref:Putative PPE family protein PPE29 n=1 Tax=Mycobacterium pseudokansasii TaxID=2341080 RepID=A0A498QYS4_9MYCO|nr:PPE family protein [Mycobacterium pseudokansasii]VBA53900.1 putative PPE family protein PPE29 [Mycobacterium pseudokansasii]